jgi:hypothetical protein
MPSDSAFGNQITGPMPEAFDSLEDVVVAADLGPQPAAHSVVLFREQLNAQPSATLNAAYYAEVTFAGGAGLSSFLCDWRGQFSIVCSRLEVRARSYPPRTDLYNRGGLDGGGNPVDRFRHGAVVGYGGWSASKPLTFTASEWVFDPTDDISWVQVIQVPRFGRRFFPRLGRVPGALGSAASPWYRADLESFALGITQVGGPPGAVTQSEMLSVPVVRDGIDVSNAGYVTVTCAGAALATKYYLASVFELGL